MCFLGRKSHYTLRDVGKVAHARRLRVVPYYTPRAVGKLVVWAELGTTRSALWEKYSVPMC